MVPRVALVGIGGYGETLLGVLRTATAEGTCKIVAAVVRTPGKYRRSEAMLRALGVRSYRTVEALLSVEAVQLDLVVIAGGVSCHASASVAALDAGCHVLCEKPAAGSLSDARRMQAAAAGAGRVLAIGYQAMFGPAIRRLKALRVSGELGALQSARARICVPRGARYYQRRDWGGRQQTGGVAVLDSPIQNATAHHLQHMLYLAGEGEREAARPTAVTAENYRASRDAWADTQYLQIDTHEGVRIAMLSTHACLQSLDVRVEYAFEEGRVIAVADRAVIRGESGRYEEVRDPQHAVVLPLRAVIRSMKTGEQPACTIDNALQHTACVEAAFAAATPRLVSPDAVVMATPPSSLPRHAGGSVTAIRGIERVVESAHDVATGYAGIGAYWAANPRSVMLRDDLVVVRTA